MENGILKRILALLGLILFLAVLILVPIALYGDSLYRSVFAAPEAVEAASYVTSFDLLAEEAKHQANSRVNGWLGMVEEQEVSVGSARGTLYASLYQPVGDAGDTPWAILFHGGVGTDRTQLLDVACMLSIRGYCVLLPDLYAHGRSDGEASTLGYGDAQDVHTWIDYAKKMQKDAKIVLFGFDEGAAAVLTAAADGLDDSVVAIAADSACNDPAARMRSVADMKEGSLQEMLLTHVFKKKAGGKSGLLSERLTNVTTPILLIHGTGDQIVPAWNSEDIACGSAFAQLLFVEGAGHGQARYLDEMLYYDTLLAFYENALN